MAYRCGKEYGFFCLRPCAPHSSRRLSMASMSEEGRKDPHVWLDSLGLDIFETPVTVPPQQEISKALNSSKFPKNYLTFTFGERTFTFGEITFTFGEITGFSGFLEFLFLSRTPLP